MDGSFLTRVGLNPSSFHKKENSGTIAQFPCINISTCINFVAGYGPGMVPTLHSWPLCEYVVAFGDICGWSDFRLLGTNTTVCLIM